MIKAFSWDYFKKSGDIDAYMTYKKFDEFENEINFGANTEDDV